jgi:PAP_fibrillin
MRLCFILGIVLGPSHGFMLSPSNYQTHPSPWKLKDSTIPDDSMASTEFTLDDNEKGQGTMVNGATMSSDSFSQDSKDYQEESKNSEDSSINADTALIKLLQLAATTGRGEFATKEQREEEAMNYIATLESNNPTLQPTLSPILQGTWELVFSNTQLFRSSPFFMAGRAVCQTMDQAKQYDWFCDMHRKALAISTIGAVRHVISSERLVSEFEVQAGAVPFLRDLTPFSYSGGLPVGYIRIFFML